MKRSSNLKRDFPYIKQEQWYTCGPACLRAVYRYHGIRLGEAKLAQFLGTNSWKGTKEVTFARVARALGISHKAGQRFSYSLLEKFVKAGHPVLVSYLEPKHNSGHYSVVVEANLSGICLRDPESGKDIVLEKKNFIRRWKGQFYKTQHFALVFKKL